MCITFFKFVYKTVVVKDTFFYLKNENIKVPCSVIYFMGEVL